MIIGVPRITHWNEHRVGLTPFVVAHLVKHGHSVLLERDAGLDARFTDKDYQDAGAMIVYTRDEVYGRADMLCHVSIIAPMELPYIKPGTVMCGFLHLAVAPRHTVTRLMELKATLIGYEIIRDKNNELPVLIPMSEMAGQMALHLAAYYLQTSPGGRGVLMGNVAGVPPPTVLILGAGAVGHAAARTALAIGAHVVVVDSDYGKLRALNGQFYGKLVTVVSGVEMLKRYTAIADVIIGAVLVPGGRAPFLVTEPMVRAMKAGSVIVDLSIDQGGCVETSRPTTLENPTFVLHNVIHYCVPNLTADIARTSSRALANAAIPFVLALANKGIEVALREDPGLAAGVYMYNGSIVHPMIAQIVGVPVVPLEELV
jgi:alanine dehydrogenase